MNTIMKLRAIGRVALSRPQQALHHCEFQTLTRNPNSPVINSQPPLPPTIPRRLHTTSRSPLSATSSIPNNVSQSAPASDYPKRIPIESNQTNEFVYLHKIPTALVMEDATLKKEIWQISAPSYVDPTSIIERELNYCQHIYQIRDSKQRLSAFTMMGDPVPLMIDGVMRTTVYAGWGVTSEEARYSGLLIRLLFKHAFADAEKQNSGVIIWYTTPSPSIFHGVNQSLPHNQPLQDGSYTNEGARTILAIRSLKSGWPPYESGSHPFVLKKVAHGTLYSESECQRIRAIELKHKFTLFQDLGIDEKQGDRLLRIGWF